MNQEFAFCSDDVFRKKVRHVDYPGKGVPVKSERYFQRSKDMLKRGERFKVDRKKSPYDADSYYDLEK